MSISVKSILGFIKSPFPILILLTIVGILAFILFFLQKKNYKWLLWTSIPTLAAGSIFLVIYLFGSTILAFLISDLTKAEQSILKPIVNMIMSNMLIIGIILLVVSIVLIIVYICLNKIKQKKENKTTTNKKEENED